MNSHLEIRSAPKSKPRRCFHLAKEAAAFPREATLPSSPCSSFIPRCILIYSPGWSALAASSRLRRNPSPCSSSLASPQARGCSLQKSRGG